MDLKTLKDRPVEWLRGGPEGDVVVSSRVRFARNVDGYPFIGRCTEQQRARLEELVRNVLMRPGMLPRLNYVRLDGLDGLLRDLLLERHLISSEHAAADWVRAVAFDETEKVSIMVNEEDHLRIQLILGGLRLEEAYRAADRLDDVLAESIPFAYSDRYGYLTACPTNVGTGMRASVMLHLPGMVMGHEMDRVFKLAQERKLTVRGIFGEGTHGAGDLYQISNRVTLGLTEEEIVAGVRDAALELTAQERTARQTLYRQHRREFRRRVRRAFELLCSAASISSLEALSFLSQVRMGLAMDALSGASMEVVNDLFLLTLPAHLQTMEGRELDSEVRDRVRAAYVRDRLTTG